MSIIFGPVPSRRLGRSLGINNIPPKICSYACNYCQLGGTLRMQIRRRAFFTPQEIYTKVKEYVKRLTDSKESIDYLAFVPDGEPTLDINLGQTIDLLKNFGIPVAVISNASLISDKQVRRDLAKADWVSLKIDAGDEELWHKIDRPHGKIDFETMQEGMISFRAIFKGVLATETMLIKGLNDSEQTAESIAGVLKRLRADICYLSIPTRPPAENDVYPAAPEDINRTYQIISSYVNSVELITGYEGNEFSASGDTRADILNITSVHPMRKDAVDALIAKNKASPSIIDTMLKNEEILCSEFSGNLFYIRNFKKNISY
jgi:wyosine [tRNA(Phe)-imidazoG37] synthetase (radical SAM superfamily)